MINVVLIEPIYTVTMLLYHRVLITQRLYQHRKMKHKFSNITCQMSRKKAYWHLGSSSGRDAGFTLVELLAVLAIFITIGIFVISIIVSTLRGNNKTNAVAIVQTNGTYALASMTKLIRNARALAPSMTCGTIANPTVSTSLGVTDVDGNATTYSCATGQDGSKYIASNSAALTDPSLVTWNTCQFTCGRTSISDYPVIGIQFALQYVSPGGGNLVEQTASSSAVLFQTSVIMRNMQR